MKNINIKFIINTLEDFHIGSGLEKIGVYDDGQYKDKDNKPAIKNETFKGLLKQSCRELVGIELFDKELFDKIFNFENQNSLDVDIKLKENDDDKNYFIVHTFTSVEHKTKRAKDNSLHNIEFAGKGLKFCGEINFLIKDDNEAEKIEEFLKKGLKNLKWWGGYRRRGFGKIKIHMIDKEDENCIKSLEKVEKKDNNEDTTTILSLILELQEDATIAGKASAGNIIETLDYIPATSILGMTRFVLMSSQKDVFDYLNDSKIKVSNFYPVPSKKDFNIEEISGKFKEIHNAFIAPVPLSLRQNKATEIEFGGDFEGKNIPHWALKSNKKAFAEIVNKDSLIGRDSASQDEGSDKSFSGGYIYTPIESLDSKNILSNSTYTKVKTILSMRNHIETKKQSSKKKGGLFSQEKIKKGAIFKGKIVFDSVDDAKKFKEHFNDYLAGNRNFHVGRGGKPVKVIDYKFLNTDNKVTDIKLNDKKFTITFLSDVILFDNKLNRVKSLNADILADKLGIENKKIKDKDGNEKYELTLKSKVDAGRIIQNYNGLSGLRRFSDMAIKKGSAYCFEYTGNENIAKKLKELEKNGLGVRKFEDFGDVKVNYPIHFDVFKLSEEEKKRREEENKNKKEKNKLSKIEEAKMSSFYIKKLEMNDKSYKKAEEIKKAIKDDKTKNVINNLISIIEANRGNLIEVDKYLAKQVKKETTKKYYEKFKEEWDKYHENNNIFNAEVFILALEKLKGGSNGK